MNLAAVLNRAVVMFSSISSQCNIAVPNPSSSYLYCMWCKLCTCVYINTNNVMERPEKQRVMCNVSKTRLGAENAKDGEQNVR